MSVRAILAVAIGSATIGASAQGYLGATERVEFIFGGSVFPNITLLFEEANDSEISAGFFHCVSPQTELGLVVGKASMKVPLDISVSDIRSSGTTEMAGAVVRAEMRYYLRSISHSTAPMGYYIRPAFQYQRLASEYTVQVDLNQGSGQDSLVTRSMESDGSTMILGFGFGRQSFFGDHFTLDWVLTTGYPVSISVDGPIDKSTVSKQLFRSQIFGVRFGVGYQF